MESHLWQWFSWTKRFLCSMFTPWPSSLYRYCWASRPGKYCMLLCLTKSDCFVQFLRYFLQQIATALLIHFGQVLGMSKRKDFSWITAKKLLPVSIFYNANVGFALASLKGVNIPMYIAIKRITPLAVLVAGCMRGKGKPPTQVFTLFCTSFNIQYIYYLNYTTLTVSNWCLQNLSSFSKLNYSVMKSDKCGYSLSRFMRILALLGSVNPTSQHSCQ